MQRPLTGKHVFAGFAAAFGVIITVNVVLAVQAARSFPGLEVKNSYVASQQFNERKAAQDALGWDVQAVLTDRILRLHIRDAAGKPVQVDSIDAVVGRATHVADDMIPGFVFDGVDYVAEADLAPGNWNIRMTAQAQDGTAFQQRVILRVE